MFFRPQEPPRALQEASKRPSEGFRVEDAIRTPFWTHFGPQKKSSGPQKSKKNLGKTMLFKEIAIFSSDRFWTSIWDPPGLRLGAHLAPRHAETDLPGALGPSKSRFQLCFFSSKSVQERSKRLLRDLQAAKRAPRALQEAPGSILEPFWSYLGVDFRVAATRLKQRSHLIRPIPSPSRPSR